MGKIHGNSLEKKRKKFALQTYIRGNITQIKCKARFVPTVIKQRASKIYKRLKSYDMKVTIYA